jgi:hypothetical protein
MSTRPRKKITTTTSYKRKKKTDLAIPFFRVGNFWNKKVKKKNADGWSMQISNALSCGFYLAAAAVSINRYNITKPSGLLQPLDSPFSFSVFSFERWMLARHTLLLLLLLCEDLMYSNERAAASARLFSGVPIILG